MKGFIVASINKKTLKQSSGMESQLISYRSVMGENQESVMEQYTQSFPDYIVVLIMPVETLKKNIEVFDSLEKQNKQNKSVMK